MLLEVVVYAIGLLCVQSIARGTETLSEETTSLILSYEKKFCSSCKAPDNSGGELAVPIENVTTGLCRSCDTCKCDSTCRFFGDCCTDRHLGKGKFDFHCHPLSDKEGFLIVSTCSEGAVNYSTDLARKCNNFDDHNVTESRFVSINEDDGTDITFRNIFCAFCHGYKDVKKWNYKVSCIDIPENIGDMTDANAIFSLLMDTGSCLMTQITTGVNTRACRPNIHATECNVTGNWREYNAEIDASCHAYYNPTLNGYANIFCEWCNTNHVSGETMCYGSTIDDFYNFAAMLTFEEEVEPENPECEKGYHWDVLTDQCLQIICPPFHQLQNTECIQTIPIESLLYIMKISLFPYENESIHIKVVSMTTLSEVLFDFYTSVSIGARSSLEWKFYMFTSRMYYKPVYGSQTNVVKRVDIVLYAAIQDSNSFANFTADLSSLQFGDVQIVYNGTTYNFLSRLQTTTEHNNGGLQTMDINLNPIPRGLSDLAPDIPNMVFSPKYIRRNCAQIKYLEPEYVATRNDTTILLVDSNMVIPESLTTRSVNNSLLVCLSTIKQLGERYREMSMLSDTQKRGGPLTMLSIVCLSISLFFLALTFVIYCAFSELRTVPGCNLMFLIASLFLAQGLFLLGARFTEYRIACIVIGVLLHYLWMVTFSWMIVCTFHAFRVFRNVLSSLNQYTNKRLVMLKYSLFAYLIPGIVIVLNIVSNYFITNKSSSIGYSEGKSMCFVIPGMISMLAFGLPVLVTILATGFCFIYTIVSFRRASIDRVRAGQKSRGILFTVLKLSTITCLSWLFGLLGSALSFQPFQYVFVILAAGQGLFIFFGFVVNRRVLELFRRVRDVKQSSNKSTSTSVTYTTSSGEVGSLRHTLEK